jgi:hypothetical protein
MGIVDHEHCGSLGYSVLEVTGLLYRTLPEQLGLVCSIHLRSQRCEINYQAHFLTVSSQALTRTLIGFFQKPKCAFERKTTYL